MTNEFNAWFKDMFIDEAKAALNNRQNVSSGGIDRYDEGVVAGKQAEYDAFWDTYQQNGNRTNYQCAFAGIGWADSLGYPKYGVTPYEAYMMFGYGSYSGDLDDIFANRGLQLDFSKCYNFNYLFIQSNITAVGTIDMRSAIYADSVFASPRLTTIRNLIPPPVPLAASAFNAALIHLTVGGEITQNMNLSRCNLLTDASVQSVFDHLKDLTGATAQTLTFHSDVKANMTEQQIQEVYNKNWILG